MKEFRSGSSINFYLQIFDLENKLINIDQSKSGEFPEEINNEIIRNFIIEI